MIRYFARRLLDMKQENRRLEDANTRLLLALRLANDNYDRLGVKYEQALRDAELIAAGWANPQDAVKFIKTAHDIDRLGTA